MNAYKNFFKRLHIEFGDMQQFYPVITSTVCWGRKFIKRYQNIITRMNVCIKYDVHNNILGRASYEPVIGDVIICIIWLILQIHRLLKQ